MSLCIAFFASLALHMLVLVVANRIGFISLTHLPAVRFGIVVKLPHPRRQTEFEVGHLHTDLADSPLPMSAVALLTPELNSLAPEIRSFVHPTQVPASVYYRQSKLTAPAIPVVEPEIPQPVEQLEGIAELTLLIGEDGVVDAVLQGKSTWPSDYLNQLQEFFSKMKFQPGMIYGKQAKSRFEIEVSATYTPEIIESKTLSDDDLPRH